MPPLRRNDSGRQIPNRRKQAQQAMAQSQKHAAQRPRPRSTPPDFDEGKQTPILLRLLMILGVLLLCFVFGYMATSGVVDFLNRKLLLKPDNRIENHNDLSLFIDSQTLRSNTLPLVSQTDDNHVSLNIYHVRDNTIVHISKNFLARTREDNLCDAVNEIIALSSLPNSEHIKLRHVFRTENTAFLDMPGQFASALSSIGKHKSLLLITSILHTIQENFSPVSQVRFLIDSKSPQSGGEVDLSSVWKLPNNH